MKAAYLEVTYRHGKPLAAYYYLAGNARLKRARTERVEPGLIVDFTADGKPLGIEITAPMLVTAAALNRVLKSLGCPAISRAELALLRAA
jgi:hypothetical protein